MRMHIRFRAMIWGCGTACPSNTTIIICDMNALFHQGLADAFSNCSFGILFDSICDMNALFHQGLADAFSTCSFAILFDITLEIPDYEGKLILIPLPLRSAVFPLMSSIIVNSCVG